MKLEPWVSFNLLLLCIAFGVFQLQNVSIPVPSENHSPTEHELLRFTESLNGILYINQSVEDFSNDLKKISLLDNSGKNLNLQIKSSNSGVALFIDEKLIINGMVSAKFDLDDLSEIPFIVMNMQRPKRTTRLNINFPLLGRADG